MTISDILSAQSRDPLYATPLDSARAVARLMAEHRVGLVMIKDGEHLVGVVSERDIVRAVAEDNAALLDGPAIEIGTRGPVTCRLDSSPENIYNEMTRRRIRHMPVLEGEKIVGLVSITDLIRHFRDESSPAARARVLEALSSGSVLPGL